jgi:4-amino-4-deoxy-L-arabinose transferase-like glycosyltransferase
VNWKSILLLVSASVLAFFYHRGITLSDEYLYTLHAFQLSEGVFELSPSAFHNRFGMLVPMAALIKCFGPSPYVYTLWPLLCFLLLITGTAVILPQKNRIWALLLLVLNPILLQFAADVSHDLVMTTFGTLAIWVLWKVRQSPGSRPIARAALFSTLLFFAALTKLAIILLVPFILLIAIQDLRAGQNIRFWIWATGIGILLISVLLLGYAWYTGDPFYRWHGIEQEHNISPWSYYGKSRQEIILRLSIYPPAFFLQSPGIGIPLILGLFWVRKFDLRLRRFPDFLWAYLLTILITHWFGSTSFSSYNPLLLTERMWLLLLPPASLLSIFVLQKWQKSSVPPWVQGVILLAALGAFIAYFLFGSERPYFGLTGIGLLAGWMGLRLSRSFSIRLLCFCIPCLLLHVHHIYRYPDHSAFFAERQFFQQLPKNEQHLIVTDSILVSMPHTHFDFQPHDHIRLIHWGQYPDEIKNPDRIYYLANTKRITIMKDYFRKEVPAAISEQKDSLLFQNQHLSIFSLQR